MLAAAWLWAEATGLSALRGPVERAVGEALGRRCTIEGDFELRLSATPRLVVGEVSLADAPWSDEAAMVRVERLSLSVAAGSLFRGPLRVTDLQVVGLRARLDVDPVHGPNWPAAPSGAGGPMRAPRLERVTLTDARLVYTDRRDERRVELDVSTLRLHTDERGPLELELFGRAGAEPLRLAGRVGPQQALLDSGLIEVDLTGRLADVDLRVTGSGQRLDLHLDGPRLDWLTRTLGLPYLGQGPFRITASGAPVAEGVDLEVDVDLDDYDLVASGRVDRLARPRRIAAEATASGPGLEPLGRLIGFDGFPAGAFRVQGRVSGDPDAGFAVEDLRVEVGGIHLAGDGRLGESSRLAGTTLRFEAGGPDLSEISRIVQAALPALPFQVGGRATWTGEAIEIAGVEAAVGPHRLGGAGVFAVTPGLVGTTLELQATGPDASVIGDLFGVRLAARPYTIEGGYERLDGASRLRAATARFGAATLEADGRIEERPDLEGSDLQLRVAGPELPDLLRDLGIDATRVPAGPFEIDGHLRVTADGLESDGLALQAGDLAARVRGRAGPWGAWSALDVSGNVSGARLDALEPWLELPPLPAGAFEVAGRLLLQDGTWDVEALTARLGDNRAALDGRLGRSGTLAGLDARVEAAGPDLATFSPLAGVELPSGSFSVAGRVASQEAAFAIESAEVVFGAASARLSGLIGRSEALTGTDLTIDADGPDATWLAPLIGHAVPGGAFRVRGRLGLEEDGFRFGALEVEVGGQQVRLDGRLGAPPHFAGTRLDASGSGRDLGTIAEALGLQLPEGAWSLGGHLEGTGEEFTLTGFAARLGASDLSGSFRLDRRGRPRLEGELRSQNLDLTPFVTEGQEDGPGTSSAAVDSREDRHVLSEEPFDLSALDRLDAVIRLRTGPLALRRSRLQGLAADVRLAHGTLVLEPLRVDGIADGRLEGSFRLARVEGGARVAARLRGTSMRLGVLGRDADRSSEPPFYFTLEFEGQGDSPRAIALAGNGGLNVVMGPGRVPNDALRVLTTDILYEVFATLNPFARKDPATSIECGVYVVGLRDGEVRFESLALRTDKMTLSGRGRIDVATEQLDLNWIAKPRKGVGLSASAVTNNTIKLGGTLADPRVELKPLEAAVTTSAAVATMGLSIVARGLWDRATSTKNVCKEALKAVEKELAQEH